MTTTSSDRVTSVERALSLLDFVASGPGYGYTLAEITKESGFSKSSVLALLRTLADRNLLRTTMPGPRYLPGLGLIKLGDLSSGNNPITSVAREFLSELALKTGLTVRIAVNDNGYPVFLTRIDGPGTVRFFTPLGVRELPHVSSAGKAILATLTNAEVDQIVAQTGLIAKTPRSITTLAKLKNDLNNIQKIGYAVDDEEDALGVFCIGAAFFDHAGRCAGATSVTGLKGEFSPAKIASVGKQVAQCSKKITKAMGGVERS